MVQWAFSSSCSNIFFAKIKSMNLSDGDADSDSDEGDLVWW